MNTTIEDEITIGSHVWTGVHVCGKWQRMAQGIVTEWCNGYWKVDVMSLHGGAPWITNHVHLEKIRLAPPPETEP